MNSQGSLALLSLARRVRASVVAVGRVLTIPTKCSTGAALALSELHEVVVRRSCSHCWSVQWSDND